MTEKMARKPDERNLAWEEEEREIVQAEERGKQEKDWRKNNVGRERAMKGKNRKTKMKRKLKTK